MAKQKSKKVSTSNKNKAITPSKKVIFGLFALFFAAIGTYFVLLSHAASPALTWAPPTGYQSYPIKNVAVSTGTQTISGGGGDMWVKLPSSPTGPINLTSCRNVVIIGGQINIPAGSGPASPDIRGIYINGCTGTVHIEGVYINGDIATAEGDGIAIQAPNAIVQIQNVRIFKLYGAFDTALHNHSDIIQPWGGVKELRVDHLTGSSSYQGFQINDDTGHIGSVTIKNVNIGDSGITPPDGKGGYYLWVKCGTGTTYNFSNFYIQPRSGRTLSNSLWDGGCGLSATTSSAKYTNTAVTGSILSGKAAGGDFVPAGSVGIGYTAAGVAATPTTPPPTTPTTPTVPTTPTTPTPVTPPPVTPTIPTTPTVPTVPTTPIIINTGNGSANTGSTVAGTVTVQIPATTGTNTAKTEVYVDDKLVKTTANTESVAVNTAQLSNGSHTVTIKTTDKNGAIAQSSTDIDVSNSLWGQALGQATTKTGKIIIGSVTSVIILGALMAFNVLPIPFMRFGL